MSNNKKMTEQEINDLVNNTMDEVMASIRPELEARHAKYLEKRAKDKAEAEKAEAELEDPEDEDGEV